MRVLAERTLTLEARLAQVCQRAFESLNFPLAKILDIRVRELWSERFEAEGERRCYVLTVVTSNPSMLRGHVLAYKGSYKERAEAVVQDFLNGIQRGATVHIEVVGRRCGSLDGLISLPDLVKSGKATATSPLVRTAEQYRIPGALLHGRHLIGPSPAVAALVRRIVRSRQVTSVLDLFSGTGIATKVACIEGSPQSALLVENDPAKIEFLRRHLDLKLATIIQEDAFSFRIAGRHDLIVADPFYEQVFDFIKAQGESLAKYSRHVLLACASIEDVGWTREVRTQLVKVGLRVRRRHALYGQVVFECEPAVNQKAT
jgi:16S rRNA G966 N2-methylase RsmD